MRMLFKYFSIQLKTQLEYKLSFILTFIAQFLLFFTFYFVIYSLFNKFGSLEEFTFYEVLLSFAVIQFSFAVTQMFARGFQKFEKHIIKGTFDRFLIRPVNIYVQILGGVVSFESSGKVLQAILIFVYALMKLDIPFTMLNTITLTLMIIGGIGIFLGIFILGAAFCFITIQGLEARNIFTYGGKEMAQFPMSIYKKEFLYFFTFVIPFACINYYPLLYLLGRTNNILYAFLPLAGVLFLIPCILIFNMSMKKYTSAGS